MSRGMVVLRVDFTNGARMQESSFAASGLCIYSTTREDLHNRIALLTPNALIFDFDIPSPSDLELLLNIKRDFPSVPILMFTQTYIDELVLWALRARVWDVLIKPCPEDRLIASLLSLQRIIKTKNHGDRKMILPPSGSAKPSHSYKNTKDRVQRVSENYIRTHLAEQITQENLASLCGLSSFHYCRVFKLIFGTTFQNYILYARIKRAVELLSMEDISITRICYEVGFRDLSYFGRMFRRFVGMSPSDFRSDRQRTLLKSNGRLSETRQLWAELPVQPYDAE